MIPLQEGGKEPSALMKRGMHATAALDPAASLAQGRSLLPLSTSLVIKTFHFISECNIGNSKGALWGKDCVP